MIPCNQHHECIMKQTGGRGVHYDPADSGSLGLAIRHHEEPQFLFFMLALHGAMGEVPM